MIASKTGVVEVGGANLYYEMAGEGPDLVFVHAGFVDSRMWDDQMADFARHYRVLRYDMRGFGESKFSEGPFSHRRDLHDLLQALGIERARLVGCSMGGGAVIDFALAYPAQAAALVLVNSGLGGYPFQGEMPKPLQELMAALFARDFERAADLAVRIWIDGPRRTPDQVDARIRARAREMSLIDLSNFFSHEEALEPPAMRRLEEIRVPALVINGELDDDSLAAIAGELAARIAGARAAVISGAAHLPSMEKPEEFNRLVLGFLAGL